MARKRDKVDLAALFGPEQTLIGWFFAVPSAFLDALDIKCVQRKKAGKGWMEWTQPSEPAYEFQAWRSD